MASAEKAMPGRAWCGCAAPTVSPTVDAAAGNSGAVEGNARVAPSCGLCVMGDSAGRVTSIKSRKARAARLDAPNRWK